LENLWQIAAGDAAVKDVKDALAKGDLAAARLAQEKAVAEYTVANAAVKLDEVAGLSDQIAAAAEKKRKEEEEIKVEARCLWFSFGLFH
jgi:hypothetical protein